MSLAAGYKQQGNDEFKTGRFTSDPIYPSNLSAALYETGDYAGCVSAILRSWKLLNSQRDARRDLVIRLSSRLAKALCFSARSNPSSRLAFELHATDIKELKEFCLTSSSGASSSPATEELRRAWQDWETAESEVAALAQKGDLCLAAFSRLPLFMKPLDDAKEYYTIGHDVVIDLTAGWGSDSGNDPLKIDMLPSEKLPHVSFLFGGVGDGLYQAYKKLSAKKRSIFHTHLTLLDIHPTAIARDLCMLTLLHELSITTEPIIRAEIKATLMYSFCAAVMPGYCYDRLMTVVKDLTRELSKSPPALPAWLHVEVNTIPVVLLALDYWTRAQKTTRKMLANHTYMTPEAQWSQRAQALGSGGDGGDFRTQLRDSFTEQRCAIEATLRGLSDAQLLQMQWLPQGMTAREGRAFVNSNMEMLVNMMQQMVSTGKVPTNEQDWYKLTKVFLPPAELRGRHPSFQKAWSTMTQGADDVERSLARKINSHIENEWRTNITLFDSNYDSPKYYPGGDGYKTLSGDVFEPVNHIEDFNQRNKTRPKGPLKNDANATAWDTFNAFFDEISNALKGLEGHITVELIAGGLSEELAKMRLGGDVTRPASFPRKYTRMWLSNVPDYTHGPMNMALYVVPSLHEDQPAGASCNCLLNTGSWSNDDHYFYTYTQLLPKDVPRYLGCKVIRSQAVMDVLVLGPLPLPRPLSDLASRDELTTWLTRVLFNTLIPGRTRLPPENVRLPNNLVAFFGLLVHLHRVGFPAHWLSGFLARMLSGSMVSDIAPYGEVWPIPLDDMRRRVPSRRVRTDPWIVEFENIVATAYYAIPFPVASTLPPSFSCEPEDILVWEAKVTATLPFSTSWNPFMGYGSPYEPVTRLLFYKPSADAPGTLISGMPRIFEGAASPPPGTFFVLTAQELVQYDTRIRFRLSKRRVESMQAEKWSMVAYRQDTGQQATRPVSAAQWTPVGKGADAA
ncbi:uncharacterized protein TRAVEDRAFT_53988 [Trametes versicolor FP-101664 SS1]|uniref:DUF4470 domain-containing protein n=1 Tax=Trametes versicolor (strain FP-101664) TaxID=717944 RepID=R7S7M8_TRAVS|nr:uncharacterized protein TRAVEDRAFT_53988 [Trametes versicolor FP-101664 SS1]EIW52006.1 hypothetical protein TRAVEDRAFT_53988 [Trametes versicolor FP-101664 SS1]